MSNDNDDSNNNNNGPANIINPSADYKQWPRGEEQLKRQQQQQQQQPTTATKEDRTINHMYQLTTIEKEKVKVLYREATIKGFELYQIPQFIQIKARLNVSYHFIKTLKQMQYDDDRNWFYELARDSHAYLGHYRLAIDKLDQLEKELWLIIMNPKIDVPARVMAVKEVHSIIKTGTLLMRDLPFITNLSRLYDLSTLDPDRKTIKKLQNVHDATRPNSTNQDTFFSKNTFDGINASLAKNIIENTKDSRRIGEVYKQGNIDADVVDTMQEQIRTLGYESDPEVKTEREAKMNQAEKRFIENGLGKIDNVMNNVTSKDEEKVIKTAYDFRKTLEYLDTFIPKEHRDAITRIREISDDESDV